MTEKGLVKFRIFFPVLSGYLLINIGFVIITTISLKYDITFSHTAKNLMRQGILSSIYFSTLIYDPVSVNNVSVRPCKEQNNINYANYIRIEKFIEKQKNLHIQEINNEKIRANRFYFGYQPYDEPRLVKLREKYQLNEVTASASNDFEAAVLLRNWARSQFRRRDYQPRMVNFDALRVLDNNLRNDQNDPYDPVRYYDPCNFFPLFYCQLMVSMGYQARLVQISHTGYSGHGMAEIWSDHYEKWIAMDAELNLYYEKDGMPLNLLEVHNERYEKKPSRMKIVRGEQHSGDTSTTLVFLGVKDLDVNKMIQYHSYFRIADMRNDWMTNHYFKGHPKRSDFSSLFFTDHKMQSVFNLGPETDEIKDFYWTLNQTEIFIKKNSYSKKMPLAFKTFTPNFRQFEIWVDDLIKTVSKDPVFTWTLHSGENKLMVRSVNQYGIYGIPSFVKVKLIENSDEAELNKTLLQTGASLQRVNVSSVRKVGNGVRRKLFHRNYKDLF